MATGKSSRHQKNELNEEISDLDFSRKPTQSDEIKLTERLKEQTEELMAQQVQIKERLKALKDYPKRSEEDYDTYARAVQNYRNLDRKRDATDTMLRKKQKQLFWIMKQLSDKKAARSDLIEAEDIYRDRPNVNYNYDPSPPSLSKAQLEERKSWYYPLKDDKDHRDSHASLSEVQDKNFVLALVNHHHYDTDSEGLKWQPTRPGAAVAAPRGSFF